MANSADISDLLRAEFRVLERDLQSLVARHEDEIELLHPAHRSDGVNLLHYLALRQHDVYGLQRRLTELGLSSIARCEPHVMATIASVHARLGGRPLDHPLGDIVTFQAGREALDTNTDRLLGERPHGRVPRIMVTLESRAAEDGDVVRRLIAAGMDIARINGAHDGPVQWELMVDNIERARKELGRHCRVAMDLAGPKLRVGPFEEGPPVMRLRPQRDVRGRVLVGLRFEFAPDTISNRPSLPGARALPVVPVAREWLSRRQAGDEITLADARGAHRRIRVVEVSEVEGRAMAETWDTTYLETGIPLCCGSDITTVGTLSGSTQYHVLFPNDAICVVRGEGQALPWHHGQVGVAEVSCCVTGVFSSVRRGQRILFDDGKFAGVIESIEPDRFVARILDAPARGGKLRAEKGINLPDTDLKLPLFTDADLPLLQLAARRADMLSVSFVRTARDVDVIRAELASLGASELGLVLKIETQAAFSNLPEILLHAMRTPDVGVMIARGDLAVEVGYPRLAELQEEILWLAEAAHLPVIWATEVLDRLATTGRPSRAEVTDAAMAQRAECVMLNKGPYITEAVTELDDILRRMARHQRKTVPLLRPLTSWVEFCSSEPRAGAASASTR